MGLYNFATRPSAVARETPIVMHCLDKGLKEFVSIPFTDELSYYYVDDETWKLVCKTMLDDALDNVEEHLNGYTPKIKELLDSVKEIQNAVKFKKKEKMWKNYESYIKALYDFANYLITPFGVSMYLEPKLEEEFKDQFNIITAPHKPSVMQLIQLESLEKPSEVMARKYGWIAVYNLKEKPFDADYFEKLKSQLTKEDLDTQFKELDNNKKEYENFIKTIDDPELEKEIELVHAYSFIKNDRIEHWKHAQEMLRPLFLYLSKELSISLDEAINLTAEEVRDYLLQDKLPNKKELQLRGSKNCYLQYTDKNLKIIYDKKEMEEINKRLIKEDLSSEVKGIVASKGKASGRAVIVNHISEADKIQEGDILVAMYTTPQMTPYLKKCSAIVTNEGGLVAHASIISREMGIPCVIDTKNATQVFNDGDLIEVDAVNGVIKKIVSDTITSQNI